MMNTNPVLQNNGTHGAPLRWDFCSRDQITSLARQDAVVIIPTGATEQHGPHLPVGTGAIIASEIATRAAKRASVLQHGFRRLLFVNGHRGNAAPLHLAIDQIRQGTERKVYTVANMYWQLITQRIEESRQSQSGGIGHAGEVETSLMLVLCPQLVQTPLASGSFSQSPQGSWYSEDWFGASRVQLGLSLLDHSPSGVLGNPSTATETFGHRILAAVVKQTGKLIVSMSGWRYDEFRKTTPGIECT